MAASSLSSPPSPSATAYAPIIPSPLNPTNAGFSALARHSCIVSAKQRSPLTARIVRRRHSRPEQHRRGGCGTRLSSSPTLAQRLMRIKAAEAWRGAVLCAQLAQYESAAMAMEVQMQLQKKKAAAGKGRVSTTKSCALSSCPI